jgi:hypothetical protein
MAARKLRDACGGGGRGPGARAAVETHRFKARRRRRGAHPAHVAQPSHYADGSLGGSRDVAAGRSAAHCRANDCGMPAITCSHLQRRRVGDGRAVQWQDSAGRARRAAGSSAGVSLRTASGVTSRCPALLSGLLSQRHYERCCTAPSSRSSLPPRSDDGSRATRRSNHREACLPAEAMKAARRTARSSFRSAHTPSVVSMTLALDCRVGQHRVRRGRSRGGGSVAARLVPATEALPGKRTCAAAPWDATACSVPVS